MSRKFEVRMQKWNVFGPDDHESSDSEGQDHKMDSALCKNCDRLIRKTGFILGDGCKDQFSTSSEYVQVGTFKRTTTLDIKGCRLCRIIQASNPGHFAKRDQYPRVATLNKPTEWGRELFKLEFAESSGYPSPISALYLLEIPGKFLTPNGTSSDLD
jgi:hypothetical protein